jgi:hypothetical protein
LPRGNIKLGAKLLLTHASKRMPQKHTLANMQINCSIIGNKEVLFGDIISSFDTTVKSRLYSKKDENYQREPAILIRPDCPGRYPMPL